MSDFLKICSEIVPGFVIIDFSYILIVIFHFSGPAVTSPLKRDSNKKLLE